MIVPSHHPPLSYIMQRYESEFQRKTASRCAVARKARFFFDRSGKPVTTNIFMSIVYKFVFSELVNQSVSQCQSASLSDSIACHTLYIIHYIPYSQSVQ